MEVVAGVLSLFIILGFFSIHNNVKKSLDTQRSILKAVQENNNLLSEQITILKGDYKPD